MKTFNNPPDIAPKAAVSRKALKALFNTEQVVYAGILGDILVAVTKAGAAVLTGSSSMWSETIHSLVDIGNECLLLFGMRRSTRQPDRGHPFGYGRELYFWSFIVALLIFALGSGAAFYEGIANLLRPRPIDHPLVNYVVLALSLLTQLASWAVALRTVQDSKGHQSYWHAIVRSKDPPQFIVLLEDSAAIVGIVIAAGGTWASVTFHEPRYDGIASLLIGLVLAAVSIVLARESKGLLIGETADPVLQQAIVDLAAQIPGIVGINAIVTTQLSPHAVIAALSIEFEDSLNVLDVERIVEALESAIRKRYADVTAVFVKPQSPTGYSSAHRTYFGEPMPHSKPPTEAVPISAALQISPPSSRPSAT